MSIAYQNKRGGVSEVGVKGVHEEVGVRIVRISEKRSWVTEEGVEVRGVHVGEEVRGVLGERERE